MLNLQLVSPSDGKQIAIVRAMFNEYQAELGVDLCFQSFQEELESLPGKYGPPGGTLYLGYLDDQVAACGGLRALDDGACEIKRVYVRPHFRRMGFARAMTLRLIDDGGRLGYTLCRLDTLRRLAAAVALYEGLQFKETQPYNFNPEPDIVYMERSLP